MKYIKTFESFSYLEEEKVNEEFFGNLMYKIKSFFKGKSMLGKELKAEFDKYDLPTRYEGIFDSERSNDIKDLYKKVASGSKLTKEDVKLISSPIDLLLLCGYRLNDEGKFSLGTMQAKGGVEDETVTYENTGNELLQLFGFDSSKYKNRNELAIAKTNFVSSILVPNIFEVSGFKVPSETYYTYDGEFDFSKEFPVVHTKNFEYYSILLRDFIYYKEDSEEKLDLSSNIESGQSLGGFFSKKDIESKGMDVTKFSTITLKEFVSKFSTSFKSHYQQYETAIDEQKPEIIDQIKLYMTPKMG